MTPKTIFTAIFISINFETKRSDNSQIDKYAVHGSLYAEKLHPLLKGLYMAKLITTKKF